MSPHTNSETSAIARAITDAFTSPNVSDSNYEPANIVDTTDRMANGIAAISVSIDKLAGAVSELAEAQRETDETLDHILQTYRHYAGGGR